MVSLQSDRRAWTIAIAPVCLVMGACGSNDANEDLGENAGSEVEQTIDAAPLPGSAPELPMTEPVEQGTTQSQSGENADFADGNSGGPDFWKVTGVASDDRLNIRSSPSPSSALVASVPTGTVLRNLGCREAASARWCRVGSLADDGVDGWVNARFLRESGPPTTRPEAAVRPGATSSMSGDVPELLHRSTGEFEIRFSSGCTVLTSSDGAVLNAGAVCSDTQRRRALTAVDAFIREQG